MPLTLTDYVNSFNQLDADAIVGAYRFPLSVMTSEGTLFFNSSDEFKQAVNRLLQIYRIHNFSNARIKNQKATDALNGVRFIDVVWELYDAKQALIVSFEHTYIQDTKEEGHPFIAAISYNEMARWQAVMKLRKSN